VAAAGAIRRVPKYAGRVEMEQIGLMLCVTGVRDAACVPGTSEFFKLNNDFGIFSRRR
jgi:hypothetical protein